MKKQALFTFCALLAFSSFGCDDSQSIEEENKTSVVNYKVEVRVNDAKSGDADLAALSDKVVEVTANGQATKAIRISDIISKVNGIEADKLDEYLALYACDFESADGFRPSFKGDRCAPMSCKVAKEAYVNIDSHRLFYSDDAGVTEGCYSIKDMSAVLMYDVD